MFHRKRAKSLTPVWESQLRAAPGKRKLNFLYLANDVMQNSRKKGLEWIDAFWPIMGWAVKHTLRNTGDDKVMKSCSKLVNVWQERRLFGSRSLHGWLDAAGDDGGDAGRVGGSAGEGGGAGDGGGEGKKSQPAGVSAALTGQHAELAKALDAVEAASLTLAKAEELCTADLKPELLVDDVVETASDPEMVLRKLQAADNALAARRAALEAITSSREKAAQLARDVLKELETSAEKETAELSASAASAAKVATLRVKATKIMAAAVAKSAAKEGAGSKNPRPDNRSSKPAALPPPPAPPKEDDNPFLVDEPYVPEGGGDEEGYVPQVVPEAETETDVSAAEMEALLAQAAADPEVLKEVFAGATEEQRAVLEEQLTAAGIELPPRE